MTDHFNKQRAKFHTIKKAVLIIRDSMVKNIDEKKLERAAKKATVCHSYSGARLGQIKEKIEEN